MVRYVCGFMFSDDYVVLIEKNKPAWQKGLLNGVGGKIEEGETPVRAMTREFQEEANIPTAEAWWTQFARLDFPDAQVFMFSCFRKDLTGLKSNTKEQVKVCYPGDISKLNTIPNLKWLVPMALNQEKLMAIVKHKRGV